MLTVMAVPLNPTRTEPIHLQRLNYYHHLNHPQLILLRIEHIYYNARSKVIFCGPLQVTGTLSLWEFHTSSISSTFCAESVGLCRPFLSSICCLYRSGLGTGGGVPLTYINSSLLLLSSTSLSHSLAVNDVLIISVHGPVKRMSAIGCACTKKITQCWLINTFRIFCTHYPWIFFTRQLTQCIVRICQTILFAMSI